MSADFFRAPADYDRIGIVDSFEALVTTPFGPRVNALCWPRRLAGDYGAVATLFQDESDILSLDADSLLDLRGGLGAGGRAAVDQMLQDLALMQDHGLAPSLECVPHYRRDDAGRALATDVYSFHADRAPVAADTYLCSYNEAATQGLRNEEARRCMEDAATRERILAEFSAQGGGDFDAFLRDNCYDLHYSPLAGARPFDFGLGHLWRIAIEYPGCPVAPCLHRAPPTGKGRPPRLLLIS